MITLNGLLCVTKGGKKFKLENKSFPRLESWSISTEFYKKLKQKYCHKKLCISIKLMARKLKVNKFYINKKEQAQKNVYNKNQNNVFRD